MLDTQKRMFSARRKKTEIASNSSAAGISAAAKTEERENNNKMITWGWGKIVLGVGRVAPERNLYNHVTIMRSRRQRANSE
jgi:hypothetical protein